jgi:hypothetical protein
MATACDYNALARAAWGASQVPLCPALPLDFPPLAAISVEIADHQ